MLRLVPIIFKIMFAIMSDGSSPEKGKKLKLSKIKAVAFAILLTIGVILMYRSIPLTLEVMSLRETNATLTRSLMRANVELDTCYQDSVSIEDIIKNAGSR